jgi:hypothetical protein
MAEKYRDTLLNQSKIWLFGRTLADITINRKAYALPSNEQGGNAQDQPPSMSSNNFLLNQLAVARDPKFARVFAFSYEGAFFDLQRPAIFLVHGDGIDADTPNEAFDPNLALLNRAPPNVGRTGLGTQSGAFAGSVKAWAYDRADFTIRLDADTGTFDTLLLSAELGVWDASSRAAGSVARSAGSVARSAGSVARAAGSVARSRRGSDE